jgi:hypothetical protein
LAKASSRGLKRTARARLSWCTSSARVLSSRISSGKPPNARNALSSPSNQHAWRSCRKARTCTRRGWPSVATNRYTRDRLLADHHALLAEVDLHLLAGRRLEPDRRPRLGRKLPAQRCDRALDRAQAHLGVGQRSAKQLIAGESGVGTEWAK